MAMVYDSHARSCVGGSMSSIVLGVASVLGLAALVYWQIIIAEGTYLGSQVVAWTYDRIAFRYDAIKQFNPIDESWFVAMPLIQRITGVKHPLVLDVATGTGRLPLALLHNHYAGKVVGLDLSRGMLRQARAKLRLFDDRVSLVWQDASELPFGDGMFSAVTCLESLEFMTRPRQVLGEMVRVLAPGGILFLTNRVGREARLLPGRAIPRPMFEQMLHEWQLCDIQVRPWQVSYDLAIARKDGRLDPDGGGDIPLTLLLQCPVCRSSLVGGTHGLSCLTCGQVYPIREGIVHLASSNQRGNP
jgi:ubiquinone/menaquinone biosynthesis C-methylase UbiE